VHAHSQRVSLGDEGMADIVLIILSAILHSSVPRRVPERPKFFVSWGKKSATTGRPLLRLSNKNKRTIGIDRDKEDGCSAEAGVESNAGTCLCENGRKGEVSTVIPADGRGAQQSRQKRTY
jgi:hypothetical protein